MTSAGQKKDVLGARFNAILQQQQDSKRRALDIMRKLTPDSYLANALNFYETSLRNTRAFYLLPDLLNFLAREFRPKSYIEIGVRRGRSLACLMAENHDIECYGFDMWISNYAGQDNPGPDFVVDQMAIAGAKKRPTLIVGNSHQTVPTFFATHPPSDLITVDADHTYVGAKRDLDNCFANLAPGGVLIFDDLYIPQFPELAKLWDEYKASLGGEYIFIEDRTATGTGIAIRPPFDKIEDIVRRFGDK